MPAFICLFVKHSNKLLRIHCVTKGRHKSDSKGDDERQWDEEADKTVHIEDDQVEPSLATVQLTKSQVTNKKATKISKKMKQTRDFTLVLVCAFRRESTPTDNLIRLLYKRPPMNKQSYFT